MAKFLSRVTTLHGVDKLTQRGTRRTWTVLMCCNLLLAAAYLVTISHRYQDDHIITRINANCKVNQVPFPAVSICNYNLVSHKRSLLIQNILKSHNVSQPRIELFLQSIPVLMDFRIFNGVSDHFLDIMSLLRQHYYDIDTLMEEVHQRCEELMVYCSFNRVRRACSEMFRLVTTYEGHCCAFNYVALREDEQYTLEAEDEGLERYEQVGDDNHPGIVITSESGRDSGLYVVFDVQAEDYPPWSMAPSHAAKVLINDPNDYPETTVVYKRVYAGGALELKVQPYVFQSDEALRRVPPHRRRCVFHDEMRLRHTDRYSTETCMTECRMRHYLQHCGCLPYKYPRDKSTRVCEFKDMNCVINYRGGVSSAWQCEPRCYTECRDKRYIVTANVMPLLADSLPAALGRGNASALSSLQVYFDRPTCNCYHQMLLMDFTSFVATYGGIFSLSLGASLLTLVELMYLIIISSVQYLWKYIK